MTGEKVLVKGWVRTKREIKNVAFIALNDGSTINNIQIVIDLSAFAADLLKDITTGASIGVTGTLEPSQGKGQNVEILATELTLYGKCDPDSYPLQKKGHSMEFLREIAHLRFRTNTFGAVMRIRHAMSFAIHKYYNDRGFFYLHTPIITGSDAEGAGEMFHVTTFDLNDPPRTKDGAIDYEADFFGKPTNLTVSGQLEGELGALALGEIYTFGPTFRAENSNTPRHLAEFWMIEPEIAFADLDDNMVLAEDMVCSVITTVMEQAPDELAFLCQFADKELLNRLNHVRSSAFARATYTEAIDILAASGAQFEYPVRWGMDLQTEHERYLTEQHFKRPVFVTDYPRDIKAFYMRANEDGRTVAAVDLLVPGVGEMLGGSQREERYDKLLDRIREMKLKEEEYGWYLDLRRFGTVRHAGFGLGFERFVMYLTGITNIRDVLPFPRTVGHAEF